MKNLVLAIFVFSTAVFAREATVCLTAQVNADGTIGVINSSGGFEVILLEKDSASLHTLKNPFSLYDTKYNVKNPFDMSLVNAYGKAGSYSTTEKEFTGTWEVSNDGTSKETAKLSAQRETLKGNITTELTSVKDGSYMGGFEGNVNCTTAGVK